MNQVGARLYTWIEDEFRAGMLNDRQAEELRAFASVLASVDTLPKGQDAKQGLAGTEGSAVTPKAGDAQTTPGKQH
jgi:hypothetical protein